MINLKMFMNSFDNIKDNINSIISLSNDEWDLLKDNIEIATIGKNDFF